MQSALTPPLHCASILQPVTPGQVVAFESWTISAPIYLNCFTLAESRKPDLWTCVFVWPFPLLSLLSDRNKFQLQVPVCNLVQQSLSSQQFHYYFYLSIVSWQYQKYWPILILVLCLLCVTPLVCSFYLSFDLSLPFFSSWWQKDCELLTHTLVLHQRRRINPRRPMYLLIVGSHYCVMRFAYALHMRQQKILFFSPACTMSFSSLL